MRSLPRMMTTQVLEFSKAALDGVYQGMYWAFHTVRYVLPTIRLTYAVGISSCFIPTSFTPVELCPFRRRPIRGAKWYSWALPTSRSHIILRRGSMSHIGHSRSTPRIRQTALRNGEVP